MALKIKQSRTIVLPIEEKEYDKFINDLETAHKTVKKLYEGNPTLFPIEMSEGYMFNGKAETSKKTGLQLRKIKINGLSYRIRPSFILRYGRLASQEVSNALFLKRFGVPFWALALVYGKYPMWWYRLYISLGYDSIVGTTIHNPENIPKDLLADEHHIKIRGRKGYVATTVGKDCFLGMEVCAKADEESLLDGYSVFKAEAHALNPDYQPDTVNTDGWAATQNTWKILYPSILVIECFLHAFLKVRDRATKIMQEYFNTCLLYTSPSPRDLSTSRMPSSA